MTLWEVVGGRRVAEGGSEGDREGVMGDDECDRNQRKKTQYLELKNNPSANENRRVSEECHLVVEGPDLGGSNMVNRTFR